MSQELPEVDHGDPLLTPADVAAELGVSRYTLMEWRQKGEGPPAFKIGRGVRYRRSELDTWLESNRESAKTA